MEIQPEIPVSALEVKPVEQPTARFLTLGILNISAASLYCGIPILILVLLATTLGGYGYGVPMFGGVSVEIWALLIGAFITGVLLLAGGIALLKNQEQGKTLTGWAIMPMALGTLVILISLLRSLPPLNGPFSVVLAFVLLVLLIIFVLLGYPITAALILRKE